MSPKDLPEIKTQRKYLISISLILIISLWLGLEFEKLSFLGNEIKLKNPNSIYIVLWGFWFYYGFRFYVSYIQYCKSEVYGAIKKILIDVLNKRLDSFLRKNYKRTIHPMSGFNVYFATSGIFNPFRIQVGVVDLVGAGSFKTEQGETIDLKKRHARMFLILSLLKYPFKKSEFMDYNFPIIVAVIALILCNTFKWPGNFVLILTGLFQ